MIGLTRVDMSPFLCESFSNIHEMRLVIALVSSRRRVFFMSLSLSS